MKLNPDFILEDIYKLLNSPFGRIYVTHCQDINTN